MICCAIGLAGPRPLKELRPSRQGGGRRWCLPLSRVVLPRGLGGWEVGGIWSKDVNSELEWWSRHGLWTNVDWTNYYWWVEITRHVPLLVRVTTRISTLFVRESLLIFTSTFSVTRWKTNLCFPTLLVTSTLLPWAHQPISEVCRSAGRRWTWGSRTLAEVACWLEHVGAILQKFIVVSVIACWFGMWQTFVTNCHIWTTGSSALSFICFPQIEIQHRKPVQGFHLDLRFPAGHLFQKLLKFI